MEQKLKRQTVVEQVIMMEHIVVAQNTEVELVQNVRMAIIHIGVMADKRM